MAVQYSNLVNKNGTIYNTQTGQGYSSSTQLAADLGVPAGSIKWGQIQQNNNYSPQGQTTTSSTPQYTPSGLPIGQNFNAQGQPISSPNTAQYTSSGLPVGQNFNQQGQPISNIPTSNPNIIIGNLNSNDPSSGLTGQWADLYKQLSGYLDKLHQNGQTVNPNIQITPEQIATFTKQAENEINPYYSSQLAIARQSLLQNLGYSSSQIQQQEQDLQRTYGNSLRTLASNAADQGFAQSGIRQKDEGDLATSTQSSIDQARASLSNSANNAASQFAQQWGGTNLPTQNISETPRVLPGQSQFQSSNSSNPLYTLSPDVYNGLTGSQQYQQKADIQNRVSQLSQAYNQGQVNNQTRSLTL